MGVTRVELGVQTVYNFIYKRIDRGHNVQDVVESARILRDSGIKVAMHLMGGIKSTKENLEEAISGETEEFEEMYPNFIVEAKAEKNDKAVWTFDVANKVEQIHEVGVLCKGYLSINKTSR